LIFFSFLLHGFYSWSLSQTSHVMKLLEIGSSSAIYGATIDNTLFEDGFLDNIQLIAFNWHQVMCMQQLFEDGDDGARTMETCS
jgi:hypothetical protein